MSKDDDDGASATGASGQPRASSQDNDRSPAVLDGTRKEGVAAGAAADVLSREELVSVREVASQSRENAAASRELTAGMREDAAQLREATADAREREIRGAGTIQTASDDHMSMLQQVNARLVIATIEAQKLTEQVQTAKEQLETAKTVAEKANQAKSDFLSSMSHELRTPLNAILGFAQLLESGSPPPTAAQNVRLQQIIKSGWYLLELINDILDLAVIESGKLSVSREPVALIDVMRQCQAMIEAQAEERGIQMSFLPFDHGLTANADRTRVQQVLINLLSNAIKYNREHGTVEVKCSATPERIRISIKDSGVGLSAQKLEQLFQPFNRLGQEDGGEQGTGIGLVVSKRLVELMGGEIGVDTTVGVGSEFWIELVREHTPQIAAANAMLANPAPHAPEDAAPRTLLYVEDNPTNLMLVEQIIAGHPRLRMLSARDGNHGVALARAHVPDVILLDISLPGMGGFEVLKVLRKDPATAHIPVVALTAHAMRSDLEEGRAAGFFRYLTKPIRVDELTTALDDAMKISAAGLANANNGGHVR